MDNMEHIKACKEMLKESASKINMIIDLKEYNTGKLKGIEILLRDKQGYLIYKNYDDVSNMLGFIKGYQYNLK